MNTIKISYNILDRLKNTELLTMSPHLFEKDFSLIAKKDKDAEFDFNLSIFIDEMTALLKPLGWEIEKITPENYPETPSLRISTEQWLNLINNKKMPLAFHESGMFLVHHDVLNHFMPSYIRLKKGDTALFDTMNYIIEKKQRNSMEEKIVDFGLFEIHSSDRRLTKSIDLVNYPIPFFQVITSIRKKDYSPDILNRFNESLRLFEDHMNEREFSYK